MVALTVAVRGAEQIRDNSPKQSPFPHRFHNPPHLSQDLFVFCSGGHSEVCISRRHTLKEAISIHILKKEADQGEPLLRTINFVERYFGCLEFSKNIKSMNKINAPFNSHIYIYTYMFKSVISVSVQTSRTMHQWKYI